MTYDPALSTDRDWMRYRLGDTDDANPIAPDATYDAELAAADTWQLAAARMARSFASRYASKPQGLTADDGSGLRYGERHKAWLTIASSLEAEASRLNRGLWTATVTRSDLETDDAEYSVELRR